MRGPLAERIQFKTSTGILMIWNNENKRFAAMGGNELMEFCTKVYTVCIVVRISPTAAAAAVHANLVRVVPIAVNALYRATIGACKLPVHEKLDFLGVKLYVIFCKYQIYNSFKQTDIGSE